MKKRVFLAAAMAVVLAACSSGVKLDDVPVEDKVGTAPTQGATGPGSGGQTRVEPVRVDPLAGDKAGPANVARIIYFDYDSNEIKPQFQQLIEAHARYIKASSARHVVIEGHTDERGGSEYNLALGQKRAESVAKSLKLLGATDAQIEAVSFGKERPAVQGENEEAWAKNRRAELNNR